MLCGAFPFFCISATGCLSWMVRGSFSFRHQVSWAISALEQAFWSQLDSPVMDMGRICYLCCSAWFCSAFLKKNSAGWKSSWENARKCAVGWNRHMGIVREQKGGGVWQVSTGGEDWLNLDFYPVTEGKTGKVQREKRGWYSGADVSYLSAAVKRPGFPHEWHCLVKVWSSVPGTIRAKPQFWIHNQK